MDQREFMHGIGLDVQAVCPSCVWLVLVCSSFGLVALLAVTVYAVWGLV